MMEINVNNRDYKVIVELVNKRDRYRSLAYTNTEKELMYVLRTWNGHTDIEVEAQDLNQGIKALTIKIVKTRREAKENRQ